MDWIAAVLSLIGNFVMVRRKSWVAFAIYAVCNVAWTVHWLPKREWAALALSIVFLAQNIWGIVSWRRKEE